MRSMTTNNQNPTRLLSLSSMLSLAAALLALTLIFSSCNDADDPAPTNTKRTCQDITGTWTSGKYEALSVHKDGTHSTITGLSMTLKVEHQSGCHFRALHTWTNGEIGGTEHLAGVLHNDDTSITMVEVGEHPEGGTSGHIIGKLVGANKIDWEYAGIAKDGSKANVFSTTLFKEESPNK